MITVQLNKDIIYIEAIVGNKIFYKDLSIDDEFVGYFSGNLKRCHIYLEKHELLFSDGIIQIPFLDDYYRIQLIEKELTDYDRLELKLNKLINKKK